MHILMPVVFAVVAALVPAQAPTPTPNPSLIRVFVHTEIAGQASELNDRRQSVKDMTAAVAARKKSLVVVDDEAKADVVIEILDRAVNVPKVVMGLQQSRPGDPSSIAGMNGPVRIAILRAKLTSGDLAPVFTNKNKPAESAGGWKAAAEDIGQQIDKWIGERRADILKRRQRPSASAGRLANGAQLGEELSREAELRERASKGVWGTKSPN